MNKQTGSLSVVLLLFAVAGYLIWHNTRKEKLSENHKPYQSLAGLAAKEALAASGGTGTFIIVSEKADPSEKIVAQHVTMLLRNQESQIATFKQVVGKAGTFLPDVKLVRGAMTMDPSWQPGVFNRAATSLPEGGCLVSFVMLPPFTAEDKKFIMQKKLRLVLVGQRVPNLEELLRDKTVSLAVVFKKPMPPAPEGKPESPEEWVSRTTEVLH